MRETLFSIGLQGIHSDDTSRVKDIIQSTLETVVKYVPIIFMYLYCLPSNQYSFVNRNKFFGTNVLAVDEMSLRK